MARKQRLLSKVETLLSGLLTEAAEARLDDNGRPLVTFGDRLRLAEVATSFEVRRSKIEDDETPDEMGSIMETFHGHVSAAPAGSPRRKGRPPRAPDAASGAANGLVLPFNIATLQPPPTPAPTRSEPALLAQTLGVMSAIAGITSARILLLLAVSGAFYLATCAVQTQSTPSLLVLVAYSVLTVLPLVALDWNARRST